MLKSDKWIRRQCQQDLRLELIVRRTVLNEQPIISIENNFSAEQIKRNLTHEELERFTEFCAKVLEAAKDVNFDKFESGIGETKWVTVNNPILYEPFKAQRTVDNVLYEYFIKFDAANTSINIKPMISPFIGKSIKLDEDGNKIPSYGLSSYGYDIRLGRNIKVFKKYLKDNTKNEIISFVVGNDRFITEIQETDKIIDARNFDPEVYVEYTDVSEVILPPGGFLLGHTVEYFNMPRRVMGICMGKSTLARCAIGVLVTPLEPGWSGYLTLEIVNHSELPVRLQTGTGICQINFLESDEDCETSYADRGGKYQNQPMLPVDPKV